MMVSYCVLKKCNTRKCNTKFDFNVRPLTLTYSILLPDTKSKIKIKSGFSTRE